MPPYTNDVFISYRREEFGEWVQKIFRPLLEKRLKNELPIPPLVYNDVDNQYGTEWNPLIIDTLKGTKCMIAFINWPYLNTSKLCLKEFSWMYARKNKFTSSDPHKNRPIIPVLIASFADPNDRNAASPDKCKLLPDFIKDIQVFDCTDYVFDPNLFDKDDERLNKLQDEIRRLVNHIKTIVISPPDYKEDEVDEAYVDSIYDELRTQVDEAIKKIYSKPPVL